MPTDRKDDGSIRQKVKEVLSEEREKLALAPGADLPALVHQLTTYQIELEMQNEELRSSRVELEELYGEYTDLYDFAPVGYLTLDKTGLITRANLTACGLLGIERSLLLNKPLAAFIHRESQGVFYFHQQKVIETRTKQTCQLVLRRKDKTPFDAQLESIALELKGQPAVRSILTDATERRKAEEALTRANAYNRGLLEAVLDPLVSIDPDGRISDVNGATEKVTGYSRQELTGTDFSDYFTEPEKARAGYRRALFEESIRDYPLEIRHRDGHLTPVHYNVSAYRDGTGKAIGAVAVVRDTTDFTRRHTREADGTPAGGIALDFNNILAAIIFFAELAADKAPPDSPVQRDLKRIVQAASGEG